MMNVVEKVILTVIVYFLMMIFLIITMLGLLGSKILFVFGASIIMLLACTLTKIEEL